MKKSALRLVIFSLLFLLIAAPSMNFDVMLPARVSFPNHLKSIAMIDRSVIEDDVASKIEGGLTGELFGEDKRGTQIVMDGIHSIMSNSPTLEFIRTTETLKGGALVGSAFPDPIPWENIDELCTKYSTNAVLAIELYDSDFLMIPGKGQMVNVKVGIRMYDPAGRIIIDHALPQTILEECSKRCQLPSHRRWRVILDHPTQIVPHHVGIDLSQIRCILIHHPWKTHTHKVEKLRQINHVVLVRMRRHDSLVQQVCLEFSYKLSHITPPPRLRRFYPTN